MINDTINYLEDLIQMHEKYMLIAQKIELHGIKRFNRYETIENLKRVHDLKNYTTEFGIEEYKRVSKFTVKNAVTYDDLLENIIESRKTLINIFEGYYSESTDLAYCEQLYAIVCDFKKELEVFKRIVKKLGYISHIDIKKEMMFKWDHELHEYMKDKEK